MVLPIRCSLTYNVDVRVTSGLFFSASARFFAAAAEVLSAKQRNVRLQQAAK